MKFIERLIPILFIIFCGVYYYQTFSFSPDWRGYPQVLLIILFFLSIIWLLIDFFNKKSTESTQLNIIFPRIIIAFLSTLAYIFLLKIIGFYMITLIFVIFLMYFLGIKNIKLLLGVGILFTVILYLGFSIFLGVPTPKGIFF